MQARNVLIDFAHAPAIWGWVGKYSQLFPDNPHPWEVNPQNVVELYFRMLDNPTHRGLSDDEYAKAQLSWNGQLMIPFNPGAGWTGAQLEFRQGDQIASLHWPDGTTPQQVYGDFGQAPWLLTRLIPENVFQELDQAVRAEIAMRASIGSLPPNSYEDPVSIYYYDEGLLKRVDYPRADLASGLDPKNLQWWKGDQIGTWQSADGGQTWGPEGFAWDKDVAGNVGQIVTYVLAAVSAILTATGVGAAAGAALLALSATIGAWANVVDQSLVGGDVGGAMNGFLQAFAKIAGQSGVGKFMGLDKAKTTALLSTLAKLAPLVQYTQNAGMGFADAYAYIQAHAATVGGLDNDQINAIATAIGPDAARVFLAGVQVGQYTTMADVQGVSGLLPSDTASVFKIGALLGRMQVDTGTIPAPPWYALKSALVVPQHLQFAMFDPLQDLMNFVRYTLKPRYHL